MFNIIMKDYNTVLKTNRFTTESQIKKVKVVEEVQKKVDVNTTLKSPICSFLGHVDAGKTSLMDIIRNSNFQQHEAGGITQSIGSTFVDIEDIIDITNNIKGKFEVKPEIPGLLIIDTPGHEAFNMLRERGSSLCDIAVLVIDINDDLKPQAIESIKLLREKKIPFVIAATKLDRVNNYIVTEELSLRKAFKKQKKDVVSLIESKMLDMKYELEQHKIKADFYFKNKKPQSTYSIVPISSKTKEGLADLLSLIIYLSQNWMNKKILYNDNLDATIMECHQDKKHGWVLDIILKNGTINIGEEFATSSRSGERISKVRKLLVQKNINKKIKFVEVESVRASNGIRLIGSNCDNCYSGTKLHSTENENCLELARAEVGGLLDKMELKKLGVCIQAQTISNLDAMYQILSKDKIPVMNTTLKVFHEKDYDKLDSKFENVEDLEYKCLLYFGEMREKEKDMYEKFGKTKGIKFISSPVVYKLVEDYLKYKKECLEERQEKQITEGGAVYPCKLKILNEHIYMTGGVDHILMGVRVIKGRLKMGTPLTVVSKKKVLTEKEMVLGQILSIQKNNEDKDIANEMDEVCIRLSNPNKLTYERQFNHKDDIVSHLTRERIDILKKDYRDEMTKNDWIHVIELKKLLNIV